MAAAWRALQKMSAIRELCLFQAYLEAGLEQILHRSQKLDPGMQNRGWYLYNLVIIFIPYVHCHLVKAQLGLMEFSNIYSSPATCRYHPQNTAFPRNSCVVSFQFFKSPRHLICSSYYLLAF